MLATVKIACGLGVLSVSAVGDWGLKDGVEVCGEDRR